MASHSRQEQCSLTKRTWNQMTLEQCSHMTLLSHSNSYPVAFVPPQEHDLTTGNDSISV